MFKTNDAIYGCLISEYYKAFYLYNILNYVYMIRIVFRQLRTYRSSLQH